MKKLLLPVFGLLCVAYYGCSKNDTTSTPTACLQVTIVDSEKIVLASVDSITKVLDTTADINERQADSLYIYGKFDSVSTYVIKSLVNDPSFFKEVNFFDTIYNQTIYFRYCGSPSNNKSIYTGEPGHVYPLAIDQANAGTGVNFPGNLYIYNYTASPNKTDTIYSAIVATNLSDNGTQVKSDDARLTFIIN